MLLCCACYVVLVQERVAAAGLSRERANNMSFRDTRRANALDAMSSLRQDKSQRLTRDNAVHAALIKRKVRLDSHGKCLRGGYILKMLAEVGCRKLLIMSWHTKGHTQLHHDSCKHTLYPEILALGAWTACTATQRL